MIFRVSEYKEEVVVYKALHGGVFLLVKCMCYCAKTIVYSIILPPLFGEMRNLPFAEKEIYRSERYN